MKGDDSKSDIGPSAGGHGGCGVEVEGGECGCC